MPQEAQYCSAAIARWPEDEANIRAIRNAVFVVEQGVPPELEWDGSDADCLQVLAYTENGEAAGTGRMASGGQIGRMAVLASHRRRGVGAALIRVLLEAARESSPDRVYLNAQLRAAPFYRSHGFRPVGGGFQEAGIPHQRMERRP